MKAISYRHNWLTDIPNHWNKYPLWALFEDNKIKNDGNAISNVLSLSYGNIIRRDIESNMGLLPASFETYQIVNNGDIVLRLTDLQNDKKSLRVGLVKEKGIITSAYTGLRLKSSDFNSTFYYYFLHSLDIMKYFYSLGGGVRQSIGFVELKWLKLPVPPKTEQDQIVAYIKEQSKKIKHFIKKKQTFIELLKEQRQAVINKAVTKGKRFRVKNLVTINDEALSEKTDNNYQLKYIDIGNVKSDGSITEIQTLSFKDAPSRARRIVRKGDVIISTVRTYLQAITLIDFDEEDIVVSTGFAVLRPKKGINSEYLNYVLRDNKFIGDVITNSFGVSYPAINSTTLSALSVNVVLDEKEQTQIVSHIKTETAKIDETIAKAQKEIELIKEYKEAMIAEAVLGKYKMSEL